MADESLQNLFQRYKENLPEEFNTDDTQFRREKESQDLQEKIDALALPRRPTKSRLEPIIQRRTKEPKDIVSI